MKLSEHFSIEEATFSETASRLNIDNYPPDPVLLNMQHAAKQLELLREITGPIRVNSWYRSMKLNVAIPGSSSTSAHMHGFAIDCVCPGISVLELCSIAARSLTHYDQIIYEYGQWMHISFDPKNRMQILTKFSGGGYKAGLLTKSDYFSN